MKWIKGKFLAWLSGVLAPLIIGIVLLVVVFSIFSTTNKQQQSDSGDGIELSEIGEREIPAQYIPVYKEAGKKYNVAWTLLAAFHKVETNFGTSESMVSSAGAIGHFQFLPETWLGWGYGRNPPKHIYESPLMIATYHGYGVDGDGDGKADPYNIKDSAFACANYVNASGGMADLRKAVFAYNHADWYVDRVLGYYEQYSKGDYTTTENGSSGGQGKGKFKLPVPSPPTLTSPYGYRTSPINGGSELHNGLDMAGPPTTPIYASLDGTVIYATFNNGGYGNCIVIQHANGKYTLYAHQSSLKVSVGAKVKTGQQIGVMGTTGDSTGVHLHFCVMDGLFIGYQDPAPYLGL